ncbi:MAG: TylF/MycF/NovP-related O-methyltransferase [Planctomycetota bacterium]|jgi:hypothetical protein
MLFRIYSKIARIFAAPLKISYFFDKEVGRDYSLGFFRKVRLIAKFRKGARQVPSATSWLEHLRIAAEILKIPPSTKGDVVECGCFRGASSANLSLVCAITGRKLVLCDSFEGLPSPEKSDKMHYNIVKRRVRHYNKGDFAGSLDEVKEHISKFGNIDVCEFIKGYYENTLSELDGSYVLAFVDVDLHKSLEECLIALWPRLVNEAYLFTHEAQDLPYTAFFFDTEWWQEHIRSKAPGLVGAGSGLPLGIGEGSGLGYAMKFDMNSDTEDWGSIAFKKTSD